MNAWQLEEMAESRRRQIRHEVAQINLEKLAEHGDGSTARKSRPLLFKLGSGLVALGRRLRKRGAPRRQDYRSVHNEWTAEHR